MAERAHLAAVEAIDPAGLSETGEVRARARDPQPATVASSTPTCTGSGSGGPPRWTPSATRSSASSSATSPRWRSGSTPSSARLEATPAHLEEHRTRARGSAGPPVAAARDRIGGADARPVRGDPRRPVGQCWQGRSCSGWSRRPLPPLRAVATYADWVHETLARGVDDWPLGRDKYDELIRLRAFDGLDADAILEIGEQQLAENKARRVAAAREIDPTVDEPAVIDRIKRDHPDDVRGGARRVPRRHAPGPPAPDRPRHRDGPAARADRGHRHARVPAERDPVRGLLRAAEVRPAPVRDLRRHAVGGPRPERDARAQPQLDQQHEHPRGVSRATTSSSRWPRSIRR